MHIRAVADGVALDDVGAADASYENSHHNCRDIVSATDGSVSVAIDGVSANPDLCFGDDPERWRLVLSVNGNQSEALVPYVLVDRR